MKESGIQKKKLFSSFFSISFFFLVFQCFRKIKKLREEGLRTYATVESMEKKHLIFSGSDEDLDIFMILLKFESDQETHKMYYINRLHIGESALEKLNERYKKLSDSIQIKLRIPLCKKGDRVEVFYNKDDINDFYIKNWEHINADIPSRYKKEIER